MKKQKLTKTIVDKIPFSENGQMFYWDADLPGFGLRVGKTKKVYIVQGNIDRQAKRYSIGVHGIYTPETARQIAKEYLLKISRDVCPEQDKKDRRQKKLTLQDIFNIFIQDKKKILVAKTVKEYEILFNNYLLCWATKPLEDISSNMITKYHASIIEQNKNRTANQVFILLQSLYNYAQIDNDDLKNPVHVLSKKKLWAPNVRRESYIKESQLAVWYEAVRRSASCFSVSNWIS